MGWASCKPPLFQFEKDSSFPICTLDLEFDLEVEDIH